MPGPLQLWLNAFAVELSRERPDVAYAEVDRAFLVDLHGRGVSPSEAVRSNLRFAATGNVAGLESANETSDLPTGCGTTTFVVGSGLVAVFLVLGFVLVARHRPDELAPAGASSTQSASSAPVSSSPPKERETVTDSFAQSSPAAPSVSNPNASRTYDPPAGPTKRVATDIAPGLDVPPPTPVTNPAPEIISFHVDPGASSIGSREITLSWLGANCSRATLEIGSESFTVDPHFGTRTVKMAPETSLQMILTVFSDDGRTDRRTAFLKAGTPQVEGE